MQVLLRFFLLLLLSFCQAGMASDSHGINWWHLGSEYKDSPALGWLIITFLIFVFGLVKAIKKPLSLYLETRSNDIRKQIEESQKIKEESEKKLRLYEEKLLSLDHEIERLKSTFSEQAEGEKIERERAAKEAQARVLRETDETIRANFERQKNRLAEEVVMKAMALAEDVIVHKKRDQVDKALKGSFIDDLKATAKEVH